MATRGVTLSSATWPGRRRWLPLAVGGLVVFVLGLVVGAGLFGEASPGPVTTQTRGTGGNAGPTQTVEGVPTGYARSEAGAVAAATAYVTALSGPLVLDADRVEKVLNVIVAPDARAGLVRAYRQVALQGRQRLGLDASPQPSFVFRGSAVGYRVDRYTDDEARVAVWTISVAGSSAGVPVRESWTTTTARLRWLRGDWRVASLDTVGGPTPPLAGAPSPPSQLFTLIPRFEEFGYAQRP